MGASLPRSPGRRWLQAVASACALVLALASVPVHPRGDEGHVDALGAVGDETVFACLDDHPRTPHVEAPRPVQRPACPACLHRLQGRGWLAEAAKLAGLLEAAAPAAPAAAPAPLRSFSDRPSPRGPPLV